MKELLKRIRDRFLSPVVKAVIDNKNETNTVIVKALLECRRQDLRLDIIYAYRFLLNREPENDDIVQNNSKSWQILRSEISKSKEFYVNNPPPNALYMDAMTTNRLLTERKAEGIVEDYESILEKHYTRLIKKGDFVIDIGAHEGRHLAVFINLADDGKVFAFEPLPKQYSHLCEKFNKPNVKIFNVALSDSSGIVDFYENETSPEESGLKIRIYNKKDANVLIQKVNATTLEQTASEFLKIDYIKIDAEGAEIQILNGGRNVIKKHKPIISIEYGYPSYSVYGLSKESLYDFCLSMDYNIFDIYGNIIPTLDMWLALCDTVYWDYFLVPKEKIEFFLTNIHKHL